MFDYLIVGAGFAGSVLAERLAAGSNKKVLICDRRPHIGGNAYDHYTEAGILVHKYGPHIFHTNSSEVFDYLSQFTAWRPYQHRVLASVDGQGHADLIVTDTVIEKIFGDFLIGTIEVLHDFDSALTTPVIAAEVDGAYDHFSPASVIGRADVLFAFYGYGEFVGVVNPPAAVGIPVPPDVPFAGGGFTLTPRADDGQIRPTVSRGPRAP